MKEIELLLMSTENELRGQPSLPVSPRAPSETTRLGTVASLHARERPFFFFFSPQSPAGLPRLKSAGPFEYEAKRRLPSVYVFISGRDRQTGSRQFEYKLATATGILVKLDLRVDLGLRAFHQAKKVNAICVTRAGRR